jgi:hypothetical protein
MTIGVFVIESPYRDSVSVGNATNDSELYGGQHICR